MNYQDQLEEILKKHTKKEAAKMLGISVRSIQNYLLHGNIPQPYIIKKVDELYMQLKETNVTHEDMKHSQ